MIAMLRRFLVWGFEDTGVRQGPGGSPKKGREV
jgi:hypothetical protein